MDPNQKQPYPAQAYPTQGYEQPPPYFASQQPVGMQQQPPGPGWTPQQNPHQQPNPGFVPAPGQTVIVQPMNATPVNRVVLVGGCPTCHAGLLEDSFGCCAIFLAIFFFPLGILCCLAMREKRCTNCGQTFG